MKKSVLLLLWLYACMSFAQPTKDTELWTNITATGPIFLAYPKTQYWLEIQERFGENVSRLSQSLLRPGIGYDVTDTISLWVGYVWVYTTLPFNTTRRYENRIWEQFLWNKKYDRISWTIRTRLEQRFVRQNPNVGWRLRQLLKFNMLFPGQDMFGLVGSEEVFFHLNNFSRTRNDKGYDQNRYFFGISQQINKHLRSEIGYLNQAIRRVDARNYYGNYVSLALYVTY